ncbi:MAG: hypothetical protein VYE73_18055 [Acidobacteriota bacterium]|nr:hypothetical protein [Acidobacteriota bacterium]
MNTSSEGPVARGIPKAWVALPEEEAMKGAFGDHPYSLGFVPAMGRLLLTHPSIGPLFAQLYGEVMFSPESALTRQEREMVAAVTSAAQDCFY